MNKTQFIPILLLSTAVIFLSAAVVVNVLTIINLRTEIQRLEAHAR